MGRGLFSGVFWGSCASGLVLAILSLYVPLPDAALEEAGITPMPDTPAEQSEVATEGDEAVAPAEATLAPSTTVPQALPDAARSTEATNSDAAEPSTAPEGNGAVEGLQMLPQTDSSATDTDTDRPVNSVSEAVAALNEAVAAEEAPEEQIEEITPTLAPQTPAVIEEEAAVTESEPAEPEFSNVAPTIDPVAPAEFAAAPQPTDTRGFMIIAPPVDKAPNLNAAPTQVSPPARTATAPTIDPSAGERPQVAISLTQEAIAPKAISPEEASEVEELTQSVLSGLKSREPILLTETPPVAETDVEQPPTPTVREIVSTAPQEDEVGAEVTRPETTQPVEDEREETQIAQLTTDRTPSVITNRLPSISATPTVVQTEEEPVEAPEATPEETPVPEDADVAAPLEETRAFQAHAVPTETSAEDALIAIVLIDAGEAGAPVKDILALDLPFTMGLYPTMAGATDAMAAYRAAGKEIVAIPNDLPPTASPADVEVAISGYFAILDEAMAVMDPLDGRIQGDRNLLRPVLGVLSSTGHGLLTYDRGLNTAQREALRENVPAATVSRILDAELESADAIKRALDRAVFDANQDGSVILVARNFPETMKAISDWNAARDASGPILVSASTIMAKSVEN
ncbi:divergent polysaccharide deacetylase family protein [Litoreibacter roseus]|uniref:Divergent polysaccharide deacetylase n=1 Tax=Litoreibacter roseus TaxID=2601869 RepID=A0A6N6JMZ6_9RHOB|nr:divergent polysaccharide deacetylase family protein [Litoreibacter roseus]GFE66859.1 hypothetical protein KIN_39330 [Litoreibacter roseus]